MGRGTQNVSLMPQFGLNGATTGERVDVEGDIRAAGQAGYQFVELRDSKIERYLAAGGTLAALHARLRDARIAALSVNALEDGTLRSGERLRASLDRLQVLCEWAKALAAPYVVVVPSFLPAGGMPDEQVQMQTAAALRAMAGVAGRFNVRLGFEFLGFPTCSVNTVRAARGIIDEVADPRIGLVIDAFHFYAGGSRLEDLDGLDPSRLFIVHLDDAEPGEPATLSDAQRLLPGDGVIPLRGLIGRLQAAGYRGAYSLELFRPEYWTWDPAALARRGLESMRRLVGL